MENYLNNLFDQMEQNGVMDDYYRFIRDHELPVSYQIRMLKTAGSDAFRAYVDRYGLWNEAHSTFAEYRDAEDIIYYLKRHHYLCPDGETALAKRGIPKCNLFYAQHRFHINDTAFLTALMKQENYDARAIAAVFLKMNFPEETAEDRKDILLMRAGSHKMVMERIEQGTLGLEALSTLFFRNKHDEFVAYLKKWIWS